MELEHASAPPPLSILVLSAAVAGGHSALASGIKADLERRGYRVEVVDGLALMGSHFARIISWIYPVQVLYAPRLFQLTCWLAGLPPITAAIRTLLGAVHGRRLAAAIERRSPDLVVSTYMLVGGALGELTRRGRLPCPAVVVDADYGVHPTTVAPPVALHIYPSEESAVIARQLGATAAAAQLPLPPAYARRLSDRTAARARLGLRRDEYVVLVIGGTTGMGDLEGATDAALVAGATPIVVTGRNARLRRRLDRRFGETRARILGWSDDLPALMVAADCLVQNAGGMTCIEAIELDLPIVMYRPVPGHGRLNAHVMGEAGVSVTAWTPKELTRLLRAAVAGASVLRQPQPDPSAPAFGCLIASLVAAASTTIAVEAPPPGTAG